MNSLESTLHTGGSFDVEVVRHNGSKPEDSRLVVIKGFFPL